MRTFLLALFALGLTACPQQVVVYSDGGGSEPDGAVADGGTADSGADRDAGLDADAGAPDTGGMDANLLDAGPADSGVAACYVDPFDLCPDPMEEARANDTWPDASRYSGSAGCIQGDELTVLSGTMLGVECQTEPGDYHTLTIVPCDTRTLRLQIRLHMLTECEPDKYNLEVRVSGGVKMCGEQINGEVLTCTDEGADRLVQVLIPPGNTIQSWYFGVLSDAPDVRFDYDLQVSVQ